MPGPDNVEAFWEAEYCQHVAGRALRLMQNEFQPTTWQACWEYVVKNRPVAEVAAELGVSADVVYSAKCRVLRRLRLFTADVCAAAGGHYGSPRGLSQR